jgi:hypothetical protein
LDTLFGHLATRFAPSPENIAIEALGYILSRSRAAREGFSQHLSPGGIAVPERIRFVTQASGEDEARPDMEGLTDDGEKACIIECKFWAGLTVNQPVTYVGRLPNDRPAVLAFIVPSQRIGPLWGALTKRLEEADIPLGPRTSDGPERYFASLHGGHVFVLTSWRAVLEAILRSLEVEHDEDAIADTRQLLGLCERMDQAAFLPFRSEELTSPEMPRRFLQLGTLTNDLCERLVQSSQCSNKAPDGSRLVATSGRGMTGRYLCVSQTMILVCFDCEAWSRHETSPLWLRVDAARYSYARSALEGYIETTPLENAVIEVGKEIAVPLTLMPGMEADQLLDDLSRQVEQICMALTAAEVAHAERMKSAAND